jgi:hypothetical protein
MVKTLGQAVNTRSWMGGAMSLRVDHTSSDELTMSGHVNQDKEVLKDFSAGINTTAARQRSVGHDEGAEGTDDREGRNG